jgi:hypothetical protein
MYDHTNPGIFMQRKQFMILIISLVTTVATAIIFAMYITNALAQGQIAHALENQAQQYRQATANLVKPAIYTADSSTALEDPPNICVDSAQPMMDNNAVPNSAATSSTAVDNSQASTQAQGTQTANNTYNNAYTTAEYVHNTNSGNTTNYSHSFNQGSYNTVKDGSLAQTNTNNNSPTSTNTDSSSNANSGQNNSIDTTSPVAMLGGLPVINPAFTIL